MIGCKGCVSVKFNVISSSDGGGAGVTILCAYCGQALGFVRAPYEPNTEQNGRVRWADQNGEF